MPLVPIEGIFEGALWSMFVAELMSCIGCGMFHVLRLASSCYDYHMVHGSYHLYDCGTLWRYIVDSSLQGQ